jgi:hypothetical protein
MDFESNSPPIDFAISHNREALDLAESVLVRLEAVGLVGWMDSRHFYSALVSAERQIELAFRIARFHCLLVGDRFRDSAWCREEYSLGLRSEMNLSVPRVLVVVESSAANALVPRELKHAPRFKCGLENEMQRIGELIARGRSTAPQVADWARRETQGNASLISRVPKDERIKLVGDHLEYLFLNFKNGVIDPRIIRQPLGSVLQRGRPVLMCLMHLQQ